MAELTTCPECGTSPVNAVLIQTELRLVTRTADVMEAPCGGGLYVDAYGTPIDEDVLVDRDAKVACYDCGHEVDAEDAEAFRTSSIPYPYGAS